MRQAMLFAALVATLPGAAFAQAAPESRPVACTAVVAVPGFEGFNMPATGPLAIGKAARVTLAAAQPPAVVGGRPFKPGTFRGEAPGGLEIKQAGRYRIAVSAKAWVAVVRAGAEVPSVAHGHGPDCSGIAKILTFDLKPGRHAIVLSEATQPAATVMVVGD